METKARTPEKRIVSSKKTPGVVLKEYLKQSRITQREFAEKVGVNQSMVARWIAGDKRVTEESALKIQGVHGIPAWDVCPELKVLKPKPTHQLVDIKTGKIVCFAQINKQMDFSGIEAEIRPI